VTGLDRVPVWVYNFGPAGKDGRTIDHVRHEVQALCNVPPHRDGRRKPPKAGVGIEALRWGRLPSIAGQRLFHDTSNLSRANIALWVREGLKVDVDYLRHTEGWDRTEGEGVHEPRATLLAYCEGDDEQEMLVIGTHAPPVTPTSADARAEWVHLMDVAIRNNSIPIVMLGDPNGLFGKVRDRVGNPKITVAGTAVEGTLTRGYTITDSREDHVVNGVVMGSDHHRAHRARLIRRAGA
jgi:hypothetical protein